MTAHRFELMIGLSELICIILLVIKFTLRVFLLFASNYYFQIVNVIQIKFNETFVLDIMLILVDIVVELAAHNFVLVAQKHSSPNKKNLKMKRKKKFYRNV